MSDDKNKSTDDSRYQETRALCRLRNLSFNYQGRNCLLGGNLTQTMLGHPPVSGGKYTNNFKITCMLI